MARKYENLIEEISNMSAIDLAGLIKDLEEKFGVSAAMAAASAAPVASQAKEASAAASEEKTEYKVTLKAAGNDLMKVIKALRQVTTLALPDAKKAAVEAPTVIGEGISKDDAKKMKEVLEAAGATVDLA